MQFGCSNVKQEHRHHYTYIQPTLAARPALLPVACSPPCRNTGSTLEFYLIVEFTFFLPSFSSWRGCACFLTPIFYFLFCSLPVCANKLNVASCPCCEVQDCAEVTHAGHTDCAVLRGPRHAPSPSPSRMIHDPLIRHDSATRRTQAFPAVPHVPEEQTR